MNELLAQIAPSHVASFILVLGRVSPLFLLAPLFSSRQLPPRVRGIAAVGLTVGIAPVVAGGAGGTEIPLDIATLAALLMKEILVGLAFAFALGALFAAVSAAGSLIDTLIGFSYGSLVDPLTGTQSTVIAQLYGLMAVAVFIAIGGDAWVIQGLAKTYDLVPLTQAPALDSLTAGVLESFTSIFAAALAVSAPVVLALIITDAAFGIVSKVVPQLNVFAIGFPAKVVVGTLVIGASLPFVAEWIGSELQRSVSSALQVLRVG